MKVRAEKNPVIPGLGVCDPHIHIFENRAYLYASHDAAEGSHDYDMFDWEIWASDDLVNWKRTQVVRPEDTPIGPTYRCWAVDAAQKDGQYYLYVSNGTDETWALASGRPGDGFREALGRPVLENGLTKTRSYDPAVFTDDDGESYIIFGTPCWAGGDSYYIARLNADMLTLAEAPRKIQVDDAADDKPFLHKYNGVYYLSWASYYATSDSVYGPYTCRGNLNLTGDHGSFFEWNGQWFMAFTVNERVVRQMRATGIAYVHYRADGTMCADPLIREYGVGQYRAEWSRIEAEWYMKGVGVKKIENTFGNFDVCMEAGSELEFPNIRGMEENPYLVLNGIFPETVEIEVWEGEKLLAVCTTVKSFLNGGEFSKYADSAVRLSIPAGDHSLKLIARGPCRLDYIHFGSRA